MKAGGRIFIRIGLLLIVRRLVFLYDRAPRRPAAHRHRRRQRGGRQLAYSRACSRPSLGRGGAASQAGQRSRTIESQDLEAARAAAATTAKRPVQAARIPRHGTADRRADLQPGHQRRSSAPCGAGRSAQAQAQYEHQQADTRRTDALAKQGVMSAQASDEAVTSLNAAKAAVDGAQESVSAAEASLKVADSQYRTGHRQPRKPPQPPARTMRMLRLCSIRPGCRAGLCAGGLSGHRHCR